LQLQAYADGLCEAAINVARERGRPAGMRWDQAEGRQRAKFERTLDLLERESGKVLAPPLNIGQVALGCALGWVDLRLGDFEWRKTRPNLAAWYAAFARRPSMAATAPPSPGKSA
jgi:glutathione S-transferase